MTAYKALHSDPEQPLAYAPWRHRKRTWRSVADLPQARVGDDLFEPSVFLLELAQSTRLDGLMPLYFFFQT